MKLWLVINLIIHFYFYEPISGTDFSCHVFYVYAKIYYLSLILPKDLWIKIFVSSTKFSYKASLRNILESKLEWDGKSESR